MIKPRIKSRISELVFYTPPASMGDALAADLREAWKRFEGINEAIGRMMHVVPETVYSWAERRNHQWTEEQIEAVIAITGGRHTAAYLRQIMAESPCIAAADCHHVLADLSRTSALLADAARQATDDATAERFADEFSTRERVRLLAMIEQVQAHLAQIRVKLENQ